jgi:hypothetical protein
MLKKLEDSERLCALILGSIFLLVGIAGFLPGFMSFPGDAPVTEVVVPRLISPDGYGHVFGIFPTNFVHNAVTLELEF